MEKLNEPDATNSHQDQDSYQKHEDIPVPVTEVKPSTAVAGESIISSAGLQEVSTETQDVENRHDLVKPLEHEPDLTQENSCATDSGTAEIAPTSLEDNGEDTGEQHAADLVDNGEISDESPKKTTSRPKLRRTSSSLPLRLVSLPKVNCRERIILCIDHSDEMFSNKFTSHSSNNVPVFITLTSAIKQFVNTKSYLNKNNQFSLILLNDGAQFITDLNRNPEELMMMLNDIATMPAASDDQQTEIDKIFDLSSMFDMVLEHSGLRDSPKQFVRAAPPFVVRLVFVYGRSDTRLVFSSLRKSFNTLIKYPQFFLDSVYIHEPVHENTFVESIFTSICDLDVGGMSHIYEVSTDSNKACLFNVFAKLLAHPLQRPKQNENQIEYELNKDPFG